jgi:hypothetical protein
MIYEIFEDKALIKKIQDRLPDLFYTAELESSRAGKIGMEVGSIREQILIALLILKFGEEKIKTNLPIHEREIDVIVNNEPLSIKTISGKRFGGFKLIWTVDEKKANEFCENYVPSCDILIVHINWGDLGSLSLFPKSLQEKVFHEIGRDHYFKLPKPGTNPRGVEISRKAALLLQGSPICKAIPIKWEKKEIKFNIYDRWLELWEQG